LRFEENAYILSSLYDELYDINRRSSTNLILGIAGVATGHCWVVLWGIEMSTLMELWWTSSVIRGFNGDMQRDSYTIDD